MVIILGIDDPLFHSGDVKLVGLEFQGERRREPREDPLHRSNPVI